MTSAAGPPAIDIRDLRKAYGSTQAVDSVDLTINQGEIVALLGPNGAGKSTTLDILLGLGRADAGTVQLFGKPPPEAIAAGQVGAMLQTGGLIQALSVRELLTMMASLYPRPTPVDDVLVLADLEDVADKQANRLSGGQTQRVRFALAVVSRPDLLVLDEPTAALDVEARHQFWQTMRRFAEAGTTIVFATHYLEEADEFADRIVLMARGRIVADGSATEIKSVVSLRTIRATLPDVPIETLTAWPGVQDGERHGDTIVLRCNDSDIVLRQLVATYGQARDVEVRSGGLDEAFRLLTSGEFEESP